MLSNLTVIIVTYKTDQNILRNCINSIDRKVKIKIIENSENFENKEIFENDFSNLSIIQTRFVTRIFLLKSMIILVKK